MPRVLGVRNERAIVATALWGPKFGEIIHRLAFIIT